MSKATDASEKGVYIGVFREGAPRNMNHIKKYEEQVGKKPAVVMWYLDWDQDFPLAECQDVVAYGAMPHIVWEPWFWSDHDKIHLNDIINGTWDEYIKTWAKGVKEFGQPIFLRVAHEFNIEGYPWSLINNDKDPEQYIMAYRHVVDIFKKEGANNARWVWCFMNYSHPEEEWNNWELAYPGDDYVDWVGIDGYNWGNTQSWSDWQAFKHLFRDQVRRSKKLWPSKPVMIAEFASAKKGGDKAEWIRELPGFLKSSMRDLDLIIWFDLQKEADWRIKSSNDSLAAYEEIMKDPIFLSSGADLAKLKVVSKPASFPVKKVAQAAKAGAVVIDGSLADWNKSLPITMMDKSFFKEGTVWDGLKDLSGNAYLMWDENCLFVAAEITDQKPLVNKQTKQNIWNGDAIEMVISADPKAADKRLSFDSRDYQFGLSTGDGKANSAIIWSWQRQREPKGSEIVVKKTDVGYVVEAKIPWEFMRPKFTPASGVKLDFDIAFDDADATGERERQFIWNGDYMFYKDPSVWGTLELK
ncbi:MAG: sugar-binding protein [bacterium]